MSAVRRHPNLVVMLAALVSALACVFLPGPPGVRVPFALLLLFALPGFAVFSALFPDGREDRVRTVAFSVGLSVVVAIIGGVEMGAYGGYSSASWAVLMAGITLCAALIAHLRQSSESVVRLDGPTRAPRVGVRLAAVAAGMASVAMIGVAIGLARTPLPVPDDRGYTEFSVGQTPVGATTIPLRVISSEATTRDFRLDIQVPGRDPEQRIITVAPGQAVVERVDVEDVSLGTVVASLVDERSDGTPYRRLRISLPVQAPAPPSADAG